MVRALRKPGIGPKVTESLMAANKVLGGIPVGSICTGCGVAEMVLDCLNEELRKMQGVARAWIQGVVFVRGCHKPCRDLFNFLTFLERLHAAPS